MSPKIAEQSKKQNALIPLAYTILGIFALIYIYFNCHYTNVWYDEGFSLFLIQLSYPDIWTFTATDVHPPLFYWILKLFSSIFEHSTMLFHYSSAIPFVLLFLLAAFEISKLWNHRTAIIFILFTFLHHTTLYPVSDIRMYSWAVLFVVATFVYGWKFIQKQTYASLILSTLFSICAAYTHYYALIAIFYSYLFFIIYTFIYQRKQTRHFILASILALVLYIPWLSNLHSQVSTVIEGYWIVSIDMRGILKAINPFFNHITIGLVSILLLLAYTITNYLLRKKDRKYLIAPLALLILTFLPSITGIIFSHLYRPVYIDRYLLCSYLLFFLGLAILLGTLDFKKPWNILIISIILAGMAYKTYDQLATKIIMTRNKDMALQSFYNFANKTVDENTAFIYHDQFHWDMHTLALVYPNNHHISKLEKLDSKMQLLDLIPHEKFTDYAELPAKFKRIFYLDSANYSLLSSSADSTEIVKYYNIVRTEKYQDETFFELLRKEE